MFIIFLWLNYGILSCILMVFFIVLLGKNKQFRFSFYRLVQCDLVLNLHVYASTWVLRLAHHKETMRTMLYVYDKHFFVFQLAGFLQLFFFHAQSISTILLCTHRYSLTKFSSANQFWNSHFFKVFTIGMLYCATVTFSMEFGGILGPMYFNETVQSFQLHNLDELHGHLFAGALFLASMIYFIVIIIIGLLTVCELKKRFAGRYSSDQTKFMQKQMMNIVLVNSTIFLIVILFQIFGHAVIYTWPLDEQDYFLMSVSDLLSLSMPYILIFFDKNVRKTLLENVKLSLYSTNHSTIGVNSRHAAPSRTIS